MLEKLLQELLPPLMEKMHLSKTYEYKTITLQGTLEEKVRQLQAYGSDGWRVIGSKYLLYKEDTKGTAVLMREQTRVTL